jgi:hypothetical protein
MSRVLTGSVRTATLLAAVALAGAGCDSITEAKDTVDTATNTVEVCKDTIALTNERIAPINTAIAAAAQNPNDAAKLEAAKAAVKTEFTALHTGLEEQIGKAKDAKVKTALESLDSAVTSWSADPDAFVKDTTKYTTLANGINSACGAK